MPYNFAQTIYNSKNYTGKPESAYRKLGHYNCRLTCYVFEIQAVTILQQQLENKLSQESQQKKMQLRDSVVKGGTFGRQAGGSGAFGSATQPSGAGGFPSSPATSVFGNAFSGTAANNAVFGSQTTPQNAFATSGNVFGKTLGGSTFGSSSGGGLFGSNTGSGLFRSQISSPARSSFFGSPTTNMPTMFGSAPSGAASQPSLFSTSNSNTSSSSFFGTSAPVSVSDPGAGLFGSTQQTSSSSFGNMNVQEPFRAAQSSTQFGAFDNENSSQNSLFGNPMTGGSEMSFLSGSDNLTATNNTFVTTPSAFVKSSTTSSGSTGPTMNGSQGGFSPAPVQSASVGEQYEESMQIFRSDRFSYGHIPEVEPPVDVR